MYRSFLVMAILFCMANGNYSMSAESIIFVSSFAPGDQGAIQALTLDLDNGALKPLAKTTGVENPFFLALSLDKRFLYSIHAKKFGGKDDEEPRPTNSQSCSSERKNGKFNMPGHVRAAVNWNNLRRMHSDNRSMEIVDGMKTIVCKLKSNPMGITSIGYPTDESRIPQWFKELPFDDAEMEATVIDGKVDNLLGVLDWDLSSATNTDNTFQTLFEW